MDKCHQDINVAWANVTVTAESDLDVPRNLLIKFGKNQVRNNWDSVNIEFVLGCDACEHPLVMADKEMPPKDQSETTNWIWRRKQDLNLQSYGNQDFFKENKTEKATTHGSEFYTRLKVLYTSDQAN